MDDQLASATRSAEGVHLGPKATARVALAPGWHALAGYGACFRSPQARSLADGEQTPFTRLHSFETGVSYHDAFGFRAFRPATQRVGVALRIEAGTLRGFTSACGMSVTQATFRESDERYQAGDAAPFVPEYVGRCDMSQKGELTSIRQRALHQGGPRHGHAGAWDGAGMA